MLEPPFSHYHLEQWEISFVGMDFFALSYFDEADESGHPLINEDGDVVSLFSILTFVVGS